MVSITKVDGSALTSEIGVTERGDPALNLEWVNWVLDGKPAILITKDPAKLLNLLRNLGRSRIVSSPPPNVIVHCTVTGYGGTKYEPNVPSKEDALAGYNALIAHLGADRVVLRIDPVIPTESGAAVALEVIKHANTRVRISFMDNYPHIRKRFYVAGCEPLNYDFHAPLKLRKEIWTWLGKPEVCGEPGFKCTGCLSEKDCNILGVIPDERKTHQRPHCACLANKHELLELKGRCPHGCVYCYWKDPLELE